MKYLFVDTETSGFFNKSIPIRDPKQAWICQIALKILDEEFKELESFDSYIQSTGRSIHNGAFDTHGITTEKCDSEGRPENTIMNKVADILHRADNDLMFIAHSVQFDLLFTCYYMNIHNHLKLSKQLFHGPQFCTMLGTTDLCKLSKKRGSGYKWPKLEELYWF